MQYYMINKAGDTRQNSNKYLKDALENASI